MSNTNKNIVDLLNECTYIASFKDYILKILIELSCQRGVIFYKTVLPGTSNKIVAIKYPMTIRLKGNPYEVKIIIYIVSDFPNKAPEIYIDNSGDPSLAANPKNQNVNPENFRVITPKLFNWIRATSIQEILTEVINSFEMNFPIYKKQNKPQAPIAHSGSIIANNFNPSGVGNVNTNSMNMSNFNSSPSGFGPGQQQNPNMSNSNWNFGGANGQNKNPAPIINGNVNSNNMNVNMNNFNNNNNQNFNAGGFNVNPGNMGMNNPSPSGFGFNNNPMNQMGNQVPVPIPIPINNPVNPMIDNKKTSHQEAEIKRLLIEEIRMNCEMKLKEDLRRLKSQEDKLSNYKQVFLTQNEKLKSFLSKKDEHLNTMNVLNHEINQENISKKISIEKFSDQFLNQTNSFEFVTIKNPNNNFLQLLSMEATIEDMFIIIKRGFEKGNISFNETVKFIRSLSREAIKIKFIREKIMKECQKVK